jgi:nicotinate phosphoribosyltransferase
VSHALLTDHYELTMLEAALRDGTAGRTAVFQVFCRSLPPGRRFGITAGLGRLLPLIAGLRFSGEDIDWLRGAGVVDRPTLDWLADYRFTGDVVAYPEGEVLLPDSPVLQVVGTFAEAVVLETLVLSVLNHDTAVASAAVRMVLAAGGRQLLEFGSRRTHEEAAVAAARAAWLVGFDGTSNLAAGRRHGVPTLGTAAHAWTLLHDDEREAFATQVATAGPGTTLLVDTYDVPEGIRRAVQAAGSGLGGVRIDSGDLGEAAMAARRQLDDLGAGDARIVVSGDLDEHAIAALREAPVDGYGVGTQLVVGSGAPTANLVYKLVARSAEPGGPPEVAVAKSSGDKATTPGRLRATRTLDGGGTATAEVLTPWDAPVPTGRRLQVEVVRAGEIVGAEDGATVRERVRRSVSELPASASDLTAGGPVVPTEHRGTPEEGTRVHTAT